MVEIKRDLKSTVNDVNSVAEALKHLQGVATSLFGVLGNLTETFGNSVGRAAQTSATAGSGTAKFFTETGVSAREELIKHLADASEQDFQNAPRLHGLGSRAVLKQGHGIQIGNQNIRTLPDDPRDRQKALMDLHRARIGGMEESEIVGHLGILGVPLKEKATTTKPSYLGANRMSGIGYSVSDLARVSNDASGFKAGSKESNSVIEVLKKLSEKNDDTSQTLAITLKQLQQSITENNTHLADATRNYRETMTNESATAEQRVLAEKQLVNAIGALDSSMQQTRDVMRHGGGGGGGGEAEEAGRRLGRIQRWAGGLGTAVGLAGAGAQMVMQAGLSMDKAVYGGELKYAQATGNIMQREQNALMEAHDMTKAENLLRYRADILMPGRQFDYIGTKGTGNAAEVARGMVRLQTDIERQERRMALTEAGTGMTQGLLKMGAGGAALLTSPLTGGLGLILGGGLLASGIGDVMGATKGGIGGYVGSGTTALEGGLGGGAIGALGRLRRGDQWDRMADFAQKAAVSGRVDQMGSLMRELQDAEIKKLGPQQIAINEVLDMVKAQQDGAVLVGEYARRGGGMLATQYEPYGRVSAEESAWRGKVDAGSDLRREGRFSSKAQDAADVFNKERMSASGRLDQARLAATSIERDLRSTPGYASYLSNEGRLGEGRNREDNRRLFLEKHPDLAAKIHLQDKIKSQVGGLETELQRLRIPGGLDDAGLQVFMETQANQVVDRARADAHGFSNDSFIKAVTRNESGGDYGVWNRTGRSDAYGRYQMIGDTRRSMAKRMGIGEKDFILNGVPAHDEKSRQYQDQAMGMLIGDYRKDVNRMRQDPSLQGGNMDKFTDFQLALGLHHRGPQYLKNSLKTGVDPFASPGQDVTVFDYMSRGSQSPLVGPPGALAARNQTPMTMLAGLEMSGAEFMRHNFALTNAMGPGTGAASDPATAAMIRLGRSGLGSFEQQLGNLTALNRVSGGRDNTANLEKLLTEAVAQGFDKSRTAQAFVQQTMQVMTSLGLTSTSGTGMLIGATARAMGGGRADERTLGEAARGLEGLGRYTGGTEGIPGALKMISASQSGIGLGQGAGILVRSSLPEMTDMIEQIRTGNLTNKSRQFLQLQGGDKNKAISALQSNVSAQGSILGVAMSMMGGFDLPQNIKDMQAAKSSGNQQKVQELRSLGMAKAFEAGGATNIGSEAAQAWYLQQQVGAGIITQADAAGLNRKITSGNEVFADPAKQRLRAYVDSMVSDFAVNNRKVDRTQYLDYVNSGGAAYTISEDAAKRAGVKGLAGRAITAEALQSGNAEFNRAADESFKDITKLDLARGAEMGLASLEGAVQSVRIVNFSEMVPALVMARLAEATDFKRRNLNGN